MKTKSIMLTLLCAGVVVVPCLTITCTRDGGDSEKRNEKKDERKGEQEDEEKRVGIPWGIERDGYRVAATVSKAEFSAMEPIILTVRLKNVGKARRRFFQSRPEVPYELQVFHVKGKKQETVPLTERGRHFMSLRVTEWWVRAIQLRPGAQEVCHFHLNRIFDMTRRGEYIVRVTREMPAEVPAMPLTITVTSESSPAWWSEDPNERGDSPTESR